MRECSRVRMRVRRAARAGAGGCGWAVGGTHTQNGQRSTQFTHYTDKTEWTFCREKLHGRQYALCNRTTTFYIIYVHARDAIHMEGHGRGHRCSRAHLGGGADGGRRHGERRNGTLEEGSDLLGGHLG